MYFIIETMEVQFRIPTSLWSKTYRIVIAVAAVVVAVIGTVIVVIVYFK